VGKFAYVLTDDDAVNPAGFALTVPAVGGPPVTTRPVVTSRPGI
jgi:hypothetical protein